MGAQKGDFTPAEPRRFGKPVDFGLKYLQHQSVLNIILQEKVCKLILFEMI
jgi:hypothetical protein